MLEKPELRGEDFGECRRRLGARVGIPSHLASLAGWPALPTATRFFTTPPLRVGAPAAGRNPWHARAGTPPSGDAEAEEAAQVLEEEEEGQRRRPGRPGAAALGRAGRPSQVPGHHARGRGEAAVGLRARARAQRRALDPLRRPDASAVRGGHHVDVRGAEAALGAAHLSGGWRGEWGAGCRRRRTGGASDQAREAPGCLSPRPGAGGRCCPRPGPTPHRPRRVLGPADRRAVRRPRAHRRDRAAPAHPPRRELRPRPAARLHRVAQASHPALRLGGHG